MKREDVIKEIDGSFYYFSDYVIFLYKQLEDKDKKIKNAIEYIKDKIEYIEMEELSWVEMPYEDYKEEYDKLLEILGDKEND